MHKNTFLTTLDVKKYLLKNMILVVWKYAQMHKNTFLTTLDVKKYLFLKHDSGGLEVCANALKHVLALQTLKISI
jgi:hypothetical protein